jgi:hypothetical protein
MMAANPQWAAFCSLLDIDAQRTDWLGEQARTLKTVLGKYMELRFGATDITYLVDIINDPAVVQAVTTSLSNISADETAIRDAVAAVVGG